MSNIRSRKNSEEFDEEYDRIFGKDKKPERGSWVQDPETGKLIDKADLYRVDPNAPAILGSPEPFVSPIDGTLIDDRAQLRRHNKKHGVTNLQDFGDNGGEAFFERKRRERSAEMTGATREAKAQRVETIKRAMYDHGLR